MAVHKVAVIGAGAAGLVVAHANSNLPITDAKNAPSGNATTTG